MNSKKRLQYTDRFLDFPSGSEPEWRLLNRLGEKLGGKVVSATADRELTLWFLASEQRVGGLAIAAIRAGGVDMSSYVPQSSSTESPIAG